MEVSWNPWHGCHKISPGCKFCYVYRMDERYDADSRLIKKNQSFDLPVRRKRDKSYKIAPGTMVWTCFTSDFFLEDADIWRQEAWSMIRERNDLHFTFITKRIHRFYDVIPEDWGDGYDNVSIGCTVENQDRADFRLPIFYNAPIKDKFIVCSPLLERIHLSPWLKGGAIREVSAAGESGYKVRVCDYEWILDIRRQCMEAEVDFHFQQTGAYLKKDGHIYYIKRKYQHSQARKAGIEYKAEKNGHNRNNSRYGSNL